MLRIAFATSLVLTSLVASLCFLPDIRGNNGPVLQSSSPQPASFQPASPQPGGSRSGKAEDAAKLKERTLREVGRLLGAARNLAPEFTAEALLRLAESDRIPDPVLRLSVIEEAFRTARQVEHDHRRNLMVGAEADTRAGPLSYVLQRGMDRLSLQCRAVRAMLPLDAGKARELFSEITRPVIQPVPCSEPLIDDVSIYFETAGEVSRRGFSSVERKRGDHIELLRAAIPSAPMHTELGPAFKMVAGANSNPEQFAGMVSLLVDALDHARSSDRAFTSPGALAPGDVLALTTKSLQLRTGGQSLVRAYRQYLVSALTGSRCGESIAPSQRGQDLRVIAIFNDQILRIPGLPDNTADQIGEKERVPSQVADRASQIRFWTTTKSRELLRENQRLNFRQGGTAFTPEERQTSSWQLRFANALTAVDEWTGANEPSEEDYFHERCILSIGLFQNAPAGPLKERAADSFLTFLVGSEIQKTHPAVWFHHADRLNRLIEGLPAEERGRYEQRLRQLGNGVFQVYGELAGFLKEPAGPAK